MLHTRDAARLARCAAAPDCLARCAAAPDRSGAVCHGATDARRRSDRLSEGRALTSRSLTSRDLALVAVFAALIAALGLPGAIAVPGLAVPVTAQSLGVMLTGCILGARRGALAVLVFLALVAAGLPLMAGGVGGLGYFAGPRAGFGIGFVLAAWVVGRVVELWPGTPNVVVYFVACVAGGILALYLVGVPVAAWRAGLPVMTVLQKSWVFVPGDLVKALVAAVVASAVQRGYPAVLSRRGRADVNEAAR